MPVADIAQSRSVVATQTVLTLTVVDQDGEPAAPAGTVTVQVQNSAGTDIKPAGTATDTESNLRKVTLTPSETSVVDQLTATWTDNGVAVQTTRHDVVGGVYCTVAEIRAAAQALNNETNHPNEELQADRVEVERQFESHCGRAFVPRLSVAILDGTGTRRVRLPHPNLREVAWAQYWTGTAWASMSGTVSLIQPDDLGYAEIPDSLWPRGRDNIRIGYRHGFDRPPEDLKAAAIKAIEHHRHGDQAPFDGRALSVPIDGGGLMQLATPGVGKWVTAIPEVDEVLRRYRMPKVA